MDKHPMLERYERECERIRQWVGQNPDHDPLPMNIALNGYRNPPPFDIRLATLMDDMALAIRALSHAAGQEAVAWIHPTHVSQLEDASGTYDSIVVRLRTKPSDDAVPLYLRPPATTNSEEIGRKSVDSGLEAVEQALIDPENQPSQWGTIPLSAIPDMEESEYDEPMCGPSDHDEWFEHGKVSGWNACIEAIMRNIRAPITHPRTCPSGEV